jgi:hypothetical protein
MPRIRFARLCGLLVVGKDPCFGVRSLSIWAGLLAVLAGSVLFGGASVARATPITYTVVAGTLNISVLVGGTQVGQANGVDLSGTFTVDAAAHSLDSLNLILDPNIALPLSVSYGGYDQVVIESASLTSAPAPAFGPTSPSVVTSPSSFTAFVGPVLVDGSWGATDASGTNPPASGQPISFSIPSMTAFLAPSPLLTLTGVNLNHLPGGTFGEAQDLVILGSFQVTAVPEPGSALLLGLGFVWLARSSARSASRR